MIFSARRITRNVVVLGLVSFCTDISSEMLYPIIPIFVVSHLGTSPALLGLIEGLADGISSGLRWVGGVWSDRTRRRKPFVVLGYGLSALSKPVMGAAAFVMGWPLFLLGRGADRFGKSIRTAARDALIADSSAPEARGLAFGFHRALDTCGAIVGPLLALLVLSAWGAQSLPLLFLVAFIPGLASVALAAFGVREIRPPDAASVDAPVRAALGERGSRLPVVARYPRAFWVLLLAFAIFSLGNSSDTFLLLRAGEVGLSSVQIILAYVLMNVVFSASATPLGHLADRAGPRVVLAAGWGVYAVVYLGFGVWGGPMMPWVMLSLYGLYLGLTDGVAKAFVSGLVPRERLGGAIGLLASVAGLGQFVGSIVAGAVWKIDISGIMLPFALGAGCALSAAVVLMLPAVKPPTDARRRTAT